MPLDPQIKPIVDSMTAAAALDPPDITVAQRREKFAALPALVGPGPELDEVINRKIAGPCDEIPVRIYRNHGATGIFVYYHGGGWALCDLDTHDELCRQLALQSESTVMSVDYRLAPENPFPAAVDDSWAALVWADANRAELGGTDDSKIVVGGDSAGGNLSAVVALMARDNNLDLAAQLLVYPCVDDDDYSPSMTENGSGYILTQENIEFYIETYGADREDWRLSPLRAQSHVGVAPTLLITAEFDPLQDQGAKYAQALESAGVDVTLTNYQAWFTASSVSVP
jgi:acetyl esterase